MGKRRSPGEGSVYAFRQADGRERWAIAHPLIGTRRRSATGVRWYTKRDAQNALRAMLADLARGELVDPSREPLAAYLATWLDGLRVEPSTLASYRKNCRLHIIPALGKTPLASLTTARINVLYRELERSGRKDHRAGEPLSARTVRYIHTILSGALGAAVKDQRLSRNPCDAASPPTAKQAKSPEMHPWTPGQLGSFLRWSAEHGGTWHPLWHFLANTGARRGEALALRWRDVDLDAGTVRIRRSAGLVRNAGESADISEGDTKSGKPRTVDVDPVTVAVLRGHKSARGGLALVLVRDDALVFGDIEGDLPNPEHVSRQFARDTKQARAALADLPQIRLHDLRHTHATILLVSGEPVHIVSQRLGHASPVVTLTVYAHVMPGNQRQAAEHFARIIAESAA
jgi:integrase